MGRVNEGGALAALAGDGEELAEEEVAAAAGAGASEFGEGGGGESAVGGVIDRG